MTGYKKGLKIILIIEIIYIFIAACLLGTVVAIMITDSPATTSKDMIIWGGTTFMLLFVPFELLPIFSIIELECYNEKKRLLLNIINSIVTTIFIFFPLMIVHFYLIYKIKNEK
ncbi:hypothetical protein [Desulfosediminicola flagellatus]|uniref:hypothetical protein n=1 Tax=Desulfosediminicola flagellatus TaxID=2569541 RepID=UPI0010AC037C|nr:hypothetical protein [Desulfosediminicola flagellatus]